MVKLIYQIIRVKSTLFTFDQIRHLVIWRHFFRIWPVPCSNQVIVNTRGNNVVFVCWFYLCERCWNLTNSANERRYYGSKNSACYLIDNEVLPQISGDPKVCEPIDTLLSYSLNAHLECPTEFLNSIEISGLLRHKLPF